MNITGMLYGSRLLAHVDFPTSEVLGPGAIASEIGKKGDHTVAQAMAPEHCARYVLSEN